MAFSTIPIILTLSITLTLCDIGESLKKFPALIIFGDSILDTGMNNYVDCFAKANHPPYGMSFPGKKATGRWSDGRLMSDMVAEELGIKSLVPPFLDPQLSTQDLKTGVNFASAGAGWDETSNAMLRIIPVLKQLDYFRDQYIPKLNAAVGQQEATNILNNCLTYILAGSNDYFTHNPAPAGYEDFLHGKIKTFIQGIYELGIRNMMVAGIPQFQAAPVYNPKLKNICSQLESSLPGSRIVFADIASPMNDMVANSMKYGVMVGIPCCSMGCMSGLSLACPNPQNYYSWDGIHPTEAVYKVMTKFLVEKTLPQFGN